MAQENRGHRARLRERMLKEGLDNFQDHEVLELLLFQYIPYKDTNKIAHNLIKKFGSFSAVLNATPEQLMTVDGISKVTACNLAMLKEVLVRFRRDSANKINFNGTASMIKYAQTLVADDYTEKLVVVYVDNATNYLFKEEFTSNSANKVNVDIRQIVTSAMRNSAAGVILFHCHVGGVCKPSEADLLFTKQVFVALASLNMVLLEHVIFNNTDEPFSFYREGLLDEIAKQYKQSF